MLGLPSRTRDVEAAFFLPFSLYFPFHISFFHRVISGLTPPPTQQSKNKKTKRKNHENTTPRPSQEADPGWSCILEQRKIKKKLKTKKKIEKYCIVSRQLAFGYRWIKEKKSQRKKKGKGSFAADKPIPDPAGLGRRGWFFLDFFGRGFLIFGGMEKGSRKGWYFLDLFT